MLVNYAWPSYIHHAYFCYVISQDNCLSRSYFYAQTIKVLFFNVDIVVNQFLIKQQQKSLITNCYMYISCIMCQKALLICMYIFFVCNIPSITVNQYKEINFGDQSFTRSGELL